MAHHGDHPDRMSESFAKFMNESTKGTETLAAEKEVLLKQFINDEVGPTGKFPEGKISERDAGEIAFAVGTENGKVILNFGKPVAWIGFTPEQALEIARTIRNKAKRMVRSEFVK